MDEVWCEAMTSCILWRDRKYMGVFLKQRSHNPGNATTGVSRTPTFGWTSTFGVGAQTIIAQLGTPNSKYYDDDADEDDD